MKPEDAYAYTNPRIGDLFFSFLGNEKGSFDVAEHKVAIIAPNIITLDNGISLSRITGQIVGVNSRLRSYPKYFPATRLNILRANKFRSSNRIESDGVSVNV
jgi:hypothetical protein